MKVQVKVAQSSLALCNPMVYTVQSSPDQNTRVGSLSLLQGIFPTQGLNPSLLHCRRILYQLSHKRSPRILEWVACPFSGGSSQPRNWTRVSCIAGRFFTNSMVCASPSSYIIFQTYLLSLYLCLLLLMWNSTILSQQIVFPLRFYCGKSQTYIGTERILS